MLNKDDATMPIPIFYACDDNFIKYTIVSIKSLIDNANQARCYIIYILNADISDAMKSETLKLENNFVKIEFIDVKEQLDTIGKNLPLRDYYSKTTYFRMFIADMFPEYKKAIYIDSDTVVVSDISKLYDVELGNNYVGACHEQAMVQTEVYGNYVERVMEISRNEYFNAGVLLINCEAFRSANVVQQFIYLLGVYNFVVTQDEDYLNVICQGKVKWLDQGWNAEVYGIMPIAESEIKILHYIMVSKPWHFKDCKFSENFWQYAKRTSVYESILKEFNEYTDEQRLADIKSCERLAETAKREALREDRFINVINKKKTQKSSCLKRLNNTKLRGSLT